MRNIGICLLLVFFTACGLTDSIPDDGRHKFTCHENWHCGLDKPVRDGKIYGVCLVGEDNATTEEREDQNPEFFDVWYKRCATALPNCDNPQCFIVCHSVKPNQPCLGD